MPNNHVLSERCGGGVQGNRYLVAQLIEVEVWTFYKTIGTGKLVNRAVRDAPNTHQRDRGQTVHINET